MSTIVPLIVIAGIDSDGKPRGAQFAKDNAKLAKKAAELMGLAVGLANTEAALAAAKLLPRGKIYASGRAFAPLIKRAVFDQLLKVLTLEKPETPAEQPNAASAADPWADLKVGSVALYGGTHVAEGWWEVVVRDISKDGNVMTCVWRGAQHEKPVKCHRFELGIIGADAMKSLRKM